MKCYGCLSVIWRKSATTIHPLLWLCTLGIQHLSIGKNYEDEIWGDIVPMDAYYVLLCWPWLFDRRVMHDGRMNTYTFTQDYKKITLTPLKPSPKKKPQDNPNLDVFLTTLLHS